MLDEFVINDNSLSKEEIEKNSKVTLLKEIGTDSLFYFGIFLLAFFVLKSIPSLAGLLNESNLGINEVVVSSIGLINIFFIKIFNQFFSKIN